MSKAQEWGGMYQRYENKNLNNIQRFSGECHRTKSLLKCILIVFKTNPLHSHGSFGLSQCKPKCFDRESLKKRRTGTRQISDHELQIQGHDITTQIWGLTYSQIWSKMQLLPTLRGVIILPSRQPPFLAQLPRW